MIRSFKDTDTAKLFNGEHNRLPPDIQKRAMIALVVLDSAVTIRDLKTAGRTYRPKLRSDTGRWEMRVNDQWRLCFDWEDGDAYTVEIIDTH